MKKVLIICFTNLKRDPRVYRQILNLKDEYEVTTIGKLSSEIDGVNFIPAGKPKETLLDHLWLKMGLFEKVYWKKCLLDIKEQLAQEKFDLIIANDPNTYPLAIAIAQEDTKLILDAHEYLPTQHNENLFWRFFQKDYIDYLCREYLPKADKVLTTSEPFAEEYKKNYNVEPVVITNATEYADLKPAETGDNIKIIYHGMVSELRGTDRMIELAEYLDDRFTLDFFAIGENDYIKKLINKAKHNPKIRFLPPVQRHELVKITNSYDIGLFLFKENLCFTYEYCLPNKFFEYIQARLMIAISPSKEMARLTKKYDIGIVSEKADPEELAEKINSLTKEDIMHYKHQSDQAAKELNSENNVKMLKNIIKTLLYGENREQENHNTCRSS